MIIMPTISGITPPVAEPAIEAVQAWIEKAVIGLNLCPFAKSVYVKKQIRYVVSEALTEDALLDDLERELKALHAVDAEQVDTTLLILTDMLADFLDYNDFLDAADDVIDALELGGEIQIASFHPHYQFAGTQVDDIENYTNRSPYPILHLLRESSIDHAVAAYPDAKNIYEKNMETLRKLGRQGWLGLNPASPRK
jgi:hypothetical protein